MATTVFFASNRVLTGAPEDFGSYSAEVRTPTDAGAITYAAAFVDGTRLDDQASGTITGIANVQQGDFSAACKGDITAAGRNLLVFLHGFANSFEDGIKRAAFNREWFAQSGEPAADTTVIAFSWPSVGKLIALPPQMLPDDYRRDQLMAGQSGFHIASFFRRLQPLLEARRTAGGRCILLAHSMGNYALQAAVQSWFAHGFGPAALFDEAILAAADERWDSFAFPPAGRLTRLKDLAARVTMYYSIADIAMYLSTAVNLTPRLGHEGPQHRADPEEFPPEEYRIADAAEVGDYDLLNPPDASHQYYRRSPRVRRDIAAVMAGNPIPPGGLVKL